MPPCPHHLPAAAPGAHDRRLALALGVQREDARVDDLQRDQDVPGVELHR